MVVARHRHHRHSNATANANATLRRTTTMSCMAPHSGQTVELFTNDGSQTFTATTIFDDVAPYWVANSDINGDGHMDLVVSTGTSDQTTSDDVRVFFDDGTARYA